MKSLILIIILWSCSFQAHAFDYSTFNDVNVRIVYSFYKYKTSDVCVCFAVNAYIEDKVFGINYWGNCNFVQDAAKNLQNCSELHSYYDRFVDRHNKVANHIYSKNFNPYFDSTETRRHKVMKIYSSKNAAVYISKNKVDDNSQLGVENILYVSFVINASGVIVDDSRGECVKIDAPIGSYFIDNKQIPFILFSRINNTRNLTASELAKLSLKPFKLDGITFAYSDH